MQVMHFLIFYALQHVIAVLRVIVSHDKNLYGHLFSLLASITCTDS